MERVVWLRGIGTSHLWPIAPGRAPRRSRTNEASCARLFEHGGENESEYRIVRSDGSTRWISGYGTFELDESGKPTFGRGVSRDITKPQNSGGRVACKVKRVFAP